MDRVTGLVLDARGGDRLGGSRYGDSADIQGVPAGAVRYGVACARDQLPDGPQRARGPVAADADGNHSVRRRRPSSR